MIVDQTPDIAGEIDPLAELYRLRELLIASREWRDRAACRDEITDHFYPRRGEDLHIPRSICARCPITDECLEFALDAGEHFGVWGGTSERERRQIRRQRREGSAA